MSSNNYYDYITRVVRTPSAVTNDVPRYGHAPIFFRNEQMMRAAREAEEKEDHNNIKSHRKHQHSPQFNDNIEVFEYEQSSADDNLNDKNGNSVKGQVCDDDSVNAEANRFIQQRHKGFELFKWKTFKAN